MPDIDADREDIRNLINSQFDCVNWGENKKLDTQTFKAMFLDGAKLFPAKRPITSQTPDTFMERMEGLNQTGVITNFKETGEGMYICVVGNVAIAMAGCIMEENKSEITYDVSMFLLLKDREGWKIAAQAWDLVDDIQKVFSENSLTITDNS